MKKTKLKFARLTIRPLTAAQLASADGGLLKTRAESCDAGCSGSCNSCDAMYCTANTYGVGCNTGGC